MHFSEKIVRDAFERSALKLSVIALSITSLTFSIMLAMDLSKDPVVIERACDTRLAQISSSDHTTEETFSFIKAAIETRFDSLAPSDPTVFLVNDLLIARQKEQDELKNKGVDQRMVIRNIKQDHDQFVVEADRLIAVGSVRSAIPLRLLAKILSKSRSLTNPYGLILTAVDQAPVNQK